MKLKRKSLRLLLAFYLFVNFQPALWAQIKPAHKKVDDAGRTYESFENDPTNLRIYTLKNGLKVYLAPNHNSPRIRTSIMVKSGSKHDPAEATGLAHYLEHLLFKGTDRYGTLNFEAEKPLLDQIEVLFEKHRMTSSEEEKKVIYKNIDELSLKASKYSLSREYNDMMAEMGAWAVNAFTNFDRVGYISNIPSNQLEKWLDLEAERFRNPQFRTFHTELETVYEEMNTIIDDGPRYSLFKIIELLFPKHQYGSQTAIGKIEHLKNPSITEIKKYYNSNYVPNNMAIILVGDLYPEDVIQMIEEKFAYMKAQELPPIPIIKESPMSQPVEKYIEAPGTDMIRMGFRFKGLATKEALMIRLVDMMLMNGRAGVFDLNINKAQKAQNVSTYIESYKDYSIHFIAGYPKKDQSLEEVRDIILKEIDRLKKGEFPDWLQEAAINDLKQNQMRSLESNNGISGLILSSFSFDIPWNERMNQLDELSKISKEEIIEFVKTRYVNNYAVVYKKRGLDPSIQKIKKPEISPIDLNEGKVSDFRKNLQTRKTVPINPRIIDFKEDIQQIQLKNGIPLNMVHNATNDLFTLKISFDLSQNNDKLLALAVDYLSLANTDQYTAIQIQEEFYKIGCSFNISTNTQLTSIFISGLGENFQKAVQLFDHILSNLKGETKTKNALLEKISKERNDWKKSRGVIARWSTNYLAYGANSPLKNVYSEEEIKGLDVNRIVDKLKSLLNYDHRYFYHGPQPVDEIKSILESDLENSPKPLKVKRSKEFRHQKYDHTEVYLAEAETKQFDLILLSNLKPYDPQLMPHVYLFNQYFGDLFFKELREARGLAYSAYSYISTPTWKDRSFLLYSRAGVQSDKYLEAVEAAFSLIKEMPIDPNSFENAKTAMMEKLRSERIVRFNILSRFETAQNQGINYDERKLVVKDLPNISLKQFQKFHEQYIKNNHLKILLVGDLNVLKEEDLRKFGAIKKLNTEDIFGF